MSLQDRRAASCLEKGLISVIRSNQVKMLIAIIMFVVLLMNWQNRMGARIYTISDALFLVGLFSLIVAGIGSVRNSGVFDIVSFSAKKFLAVVFNRPSELAKVDGGFVDYVRRSKRKHDIHLLVFSGAVCMLLSGLAAYVTW